MPQSEKRNRQLNISVTNIQRETLRRIAFEEDKTLSAIGYEVFEMGLEKFLAEHHSDG